MAIAGVASLSVAPPPLLGCERLSPTPWRPELIDDWNGFGMSCRMGICVRKLLAYARTERIDAMFATSNGKEVSLQDVRGTDFDMS